MKIKIDGNSVKNQEIKDKFVKREVYYCMSCLVDDLLKNYVMQYDDIENGFCYNWEGEIDGVFTTIYTEEEKEIAIEDIKEKMGALEDKNLEDKPYYKTLQETLETIENLEPEPQEIMEWWLVTYYLAEKLKKLGQPILKSHECIFWGRCTTGQSIILDGVITDICKEMEILEGQKYDWSR